MCTSCSNLKNLDLVEIAGRKTKKQFCFYLPQICVQSCPREYWTFVVDIPKFAAAENLANLASPGSSNTASGRMRIIAAAENTYALNFTKYICTYGYNVTDEYINNGVVSNFY